MLFSIARDSSMGPYHFTTQLFLSMRNLQFHLMVFLQHILSLGWIFMHFHRGWASLIPIHTDLAVLNQIWYSHGKLFDLSIAPWLLPPELVARKAKICRLHSEHWPFIVNQLSVVYTCLAPLRGHTGDYAYLAWCFVQVNYAPVNILDWEFPHGGCTVPVVTGRIHSADQEQAGPHRVVPALLGWHRRLPTVYF